ncbi:MAG: fatty acid desaturase [Verrucomicrobiae bacterium]|nr:fatty acid desaturase [Verrucomicrobiae bacterium]
MVAGILAIRWSPAWWLDPLFSLVIGHSLACIAFLSHDLSHNTIIRNRSLRYAAETIFMGLLLFPPTLWRRLHNQTHHLNANTVEDPDRHFLESEASLGTRWYTRFFHLHRRSSTLWNILKWNPLTAGQFIAYTVRNLIAAFVSDSPSAPTIPYKPEYTRAQKWQMSFELVVIVLLQVAIFMAVGARVGPYLFASLASYLVTSAILTAYIYTHHGINPMVETNDPVLSSTSIVVWPFIDKIHHHFSYHTEHHLFPGMNSDYYPLVSRILMEKFPTRYNRIGFREAWRRIAEHDEFMADSEIIRASRPSEDAPSEPAHPTEPTKPGELIER